MLNIDEKKNLNGGDLAFVGDAYYELCIRNHLINKGYTSLYKLHDECVKYVSAKAQAYIVNEIMSELSEEEESVFKRGRNYSYKNKSPEYVKASGFEALLGYLFLLSRFERLEYLVDKAIDTIEKTLN